MEQTVKINNINLHYRLSGSGPAMILMHGWGCNCTTLASLERVCALSHTVYNLDLPGFGQSQEPPADWGVEEYTQLLEQFVKQLQNSARTYLVLNTATRISQNFSSS